MLHIFKGISTELYIVMEFSPTLHKEPRHWVPHMGSSCREPADDYYFADIADTAEAEQMSKSPSPFQDADYNKQIEEKGDKIQVETGLNIGAVGGGEGLITIKANEQGDQSKFVVCSKNSYSFSIKL